MSRTFQLIRDEDVSLVSGVGFIAEGVLFSDGRVALHWLGQMPATTVFDSLEWVVKIHGHGGKTRVVWDDHGGNAREFDELDVRYLHKILRDESLVNWHMGARRILKKLGATVGKAALEVLESLS